MKRLLVILFSLLINTLLLNAQTQQGYVKTKGRLGNNGTVIAGTRISGVTVQIKGRQAVLSQKNGTFSFPIPAQNFYLQNVQKQGYVMTDPDMLSRQYTYSKNPLIIVLETREQQSEDKLAAEKKIRRTLQRQLQEKEDEIESLKEQKKLSDEEYRRQLQELYAQQESNEKLISEMADRYSRMDFDEVDDFNRRISQLILDGRLKEADSLINTKGDIRSRAATLKSHQEANAQTEIKLKKEQKRLEKSKEITQKELEDLAQDCFSKFEIFITQKMYDSAGYYIELRASLDTTNAEWIDFAGNYIRVYNRDYSKAMAFCSKALSIRIRTLGPEHLDVADSYNSIGIIYHLQEDYTKAAEYFSKGLSIYEKNVGSEHPYVVHFYKNIGSVYKDLDNYPKALEYFSKALSIQEKNYGPEHPDVAVTYSGIGSVYQKQGNDTKALEYFSKALFIQENNNLTEYLDIAVTYTYIGSVYRHQDNYTKALEFLAKALSIQEKNLGPEHPDVAQAYNNIGLVYSDQGNYPKALEFLAKALSIREKILSSKHPDLATSYNNIGIVYYNQGDYTNALEFLSKALSIREKILSSDHPDLAACYNSIGTIYEKMGNYPKALENLSTALFFSEIIFGTEHPDIAELYNNIGSLYSRLGDYSKALEFYSKAMSIFEKVLGPEHSTTKLLKYRIVLAKYRIVLNTRNLINFLSNHCFTVTIKNEKSPAGKQGMSGEYVLLEFADWRQDSPISIFDKSTELQDKPKDILVYKDGIISLHHFENAIGAKIGIKEVSKEERAQIDQAYKQWKKQNKK